jgi:hypothetical protein
MARVGYNPDILDRDHDPELRKRQYRELYDVPGDDAKVTKTHN